MSDDDRKLELSREDLLGYTPEQLACTQCGGVFCGLRVGRVFEGDALIMCSQKEEVKDVLASLKRR